MKPIHRALDEATQKLRSISDSARLDAELLMAEALDIDRDRLLLDPPASSVPRRFMEMIERRLSGEPVAYITGRRAFWDIELHVGPGALVPRPDSEVLIASAIDHFAARPGPRTILDLGTGPGTLLLAALDIWRDAKGLGIDKSAAALAYAQSNARRLGFSDRVEFRTGDWALGVEAQFDLILCNPPYVREVGDELGPGVREFEPAEALFGGPDGLDAYRILGEQMPALIAPGGLAAIEIGADQAQSVVDLLRPSGLGIRVANDLGARPRAVLMTAPMTK